MTLPQKHKGSHSELIACAWLLNEGYEVYRNVSAVGPNDLIIWKAKEGFTAIDVTSGNVYTDARGFKSTSFAQNKTRKENSGGPRILVVTGSMCQWGAEITEENKRAIIARKEQKAKEAKSISPLGRACFKCGKFKAWPNFRKSSVSANGHMATCKPCRAEQKAISRRQARARGEAIAKRLSKAKTHKGNRG